MVVNTATLRASPELGKALVGAWYEMLGLMNTKDARGGSAMAAMAKASGTDLPGFNSQLATTKLFVAPAEAAAFTVNANLVKTMDLVRSFSFAHGLLGEGARSVDAVGIEFPGGRTLGNPKNIKLRFDASYMQLAADGKL
jgi:NitT/TauT family transport system substrate-binding protein